MLVTQYHEKQEILKLNKALRHWLHLEAFCSYRSRFLPFYCYVYIQNDLDTCSTTDRIFVYSTDYLTLISVFFCYIFVGLFLEDVSARWYCIVNLQTRFCSTSMHGFRFLVWFFRLLQFFRRRAEYTVTFTLVLVCDGVRLWMLEYKKRGPSGFGSHCYNIYEYQVISVTVFP